jgi:hypothetical protein
MKFDIYFILNYFESLNKVLVSSTYIFLKGVFLAVLSIIEDFLDNGFLPLHLELDYMAEGDIRYQNSN